MGNVSSVENKPTTDFDDIWWTNGNEQQQKNKEDYKNIADNREKRKQILFAKKHEIQAIRNELIFLREENNKLKTMDSFQLIIKNKELETENKKLHDEIDVLKNKNNSFDELVQQNNELKEDILKLKTKTEKLENSVIEYEHHKEEYTTHVLALKDVIKVSKQLLLIRENQLTVLKQKIKDIETTFSEKEAILLSSHLKEEYERQLNNMQTLRELYETRERASKREISELKSNLDEKTKELENVSQKYKELQDRVNQLENDNSLKYDQIKSLESNLGLSKAECRQYQAELTVINQLFSQILLDFNNSQDLDLDKLIKQLEDHHDLLQIIATKEPSTESFSALPKVLLNLVNEASGELTTKDNKVLNAESTEEAVINATHNMNSPSQIVENLPKVWKILIELLSHHLSPLDISSNLEIDQNPCFKTIETSKGPNLVLSVSRTFIRLKELIMEKKALEKDMHHLKKLNTHLEARIQDQETRFALVSGELSKTWNFVEKLEKEHKILHTQEQILRYELSQKRKLLKHLREELEYSREKWQQAREKNSKTEKEWLALRSEFASRKKIIIKDENNSVESGYSDEKEEETSDEDIDFDFSESNVKHIEMESENEENDGLIEITPVAYPTLHELEKHPTTISNCNLNINQDNDINVCTSESTTSPNTLNDHLEILQDENNSFNSRESFTGGNENENIVVKASTSSLTFEERLAAKDARLSKLEGECKELYSQVTNTSNRSVTIATKLDDLHELYGESSRNNQDQPVTDFTEVKAEIEDLSEENKTSK